MCTAVAAAGSGELGSGLQTWGSDAAGVVGSSSTGSGSMRMRSTLRPSQSLGAKAQLADDKDK